MHTGTHYEATGKKNDGATIGPTARNPGCGADTHAVYCGDGVYVAAVVGGECATATGPVGMDKGAAVRLCHLARKVGYLSWVVATAGGAA